MVDWEMNVRFVGWVFEPRAWDCECVRLPREGREHAAAHMHLEFFPDEMGFQGEMDLRTWKTFDAK